MANNWIPLSRSEAVDRAKKEASQRTVDYDLGSGGYSCTATWADSGGLCDCSGFVAWCIGTDRQTNKIPGGWIETSMVYQDATSTHKLFKKVAISDAQPGDILDYGDSGGSEGHIGIITAVSNGKPSYVAHCTARGGLSSAVINEPYSTFWAGKVNAGIAIAAAYLFYEGGEDVTKTTVIVDGKSSGGFFDEDAGLNYLTLSCIKSILGGAGYGWIWDEPKLTLTISPDEVSAAIATVEAAGFSVKRRE